MSANSGGLICADWENREFTSKIQLNIVKMVEFLNKFDVSTRSRLAKINEKLTSLERSLDFLQTALQNSSGEAKA
eukprot:g2233.t1